MSRPWRFAFAAAATVVLAVVLMIYFRPKQAPASSGSQQAASTERLSNPEPLTLGNANALLTRSMSVKAIVDDIAFRPQSTQLPKGQHSALTALGKENITL